METEDLKKLKTGNTNKTRDQKKTKKQQQQQKKTQQPSSPHFQYVLSHLIDFQGKNNAVCTHEVRQY